MNECCNIRPEADACHPHHRRDYLLYGTLGILIAALAVHLLHINVPYVTPFAHAAASTLHSVWWGIGFGIVSVGLMNKVPREYFNAILGRGDTFGGLVRAMFAGVMIDLCSHGVLMIGAKLYERGASLAQVMTFLISSPWNSFTLTLVLMGLIGAPWTIVFIAASMLVALLTGYIYMVLVRRGVLPDNPHKLVEAPKLDVIKDAKARLKGFRPGPRFIIDIIFDGWREGKMVIRWLFLGIIIAALIHAFVSTEMLHMYFGPSLLGMLLTLAATTVIEVCSEGSTPIGAELVTRAMAPGNGFVFLMAGVATDYTEIMVIREFTKRWTTALIMPLVSVPQILLLGYLMNNL